MVMVLMRSLSRLLVDDPGLIPASRLCISKTTNRHLSSSRHLKCESARHHDDAPRTSAENHKHHCATNSAASLLGGSEPLLRRSNSASALINQCSSNYASHLSSLPMINLSPKRNHYATMRYRPRSPILGSSRSIISPKYIQMQRYYLTDLDYYNEKYYANTPMEMTFSEEKGRFLVAKRDIEEGEIVLEASPYVYTLFEDDRGYFCENCLNPIPGTHKHIETKYVDNDDDDEDIYDDDDEEEEGEFDEEEHDHHHSTNNRRNKKDQAEAAPDQQQQQQQQNKKAHDHACHKCGEVFYCSEQCKQEHSRFHALECTMMKRFNVVPKPPQINDVSILSGLRFLIKVLARRHYEKKHPKRAGVTAAVSSKNPPPLFHDDILDFQDMMRLMSHRKEYSRKRESILYWSVEFLKKVLDKEILATTDDEELMELICKEECNSFSMSGTNKEETHGFGVFPAASYFNHSCIPNLDILDNDRKGGRYHLVFQALHPIPKGTELSFSYIHLNTSNKRRKRHLKGTYFFECICVDKEAKNCNQKFLDKYGCNACKDGIMSPGLWKRMNENGEMVATPYNDDPTITEHTRICFMCKNRREWPTAAAATQAPTESSATAAAAATTTTTTDESKPDATVTNT